MRDKIASVKCLSRQTAAVDSDRFVFAAFDHTAQGTPAAFCDAAVMLEGLGVVHFFATRENAAVGAAFITPAFRVNPRWQKR